MQTEIPLRSRGGVLLVEQDAFRESGDTKRKAPWPDFKGSPIHEGDTIEHPTGDSGVVIFLSAESDPGDAWRVDYGGQNGISRLCLQIGNKGMACVVPQTK